MSILAVEAIPSEAVRAFLRFFATNREVEGWENTTINWLSAVLLIVLIVAVLAMLMKWLTWRMSQTSSTGGGKLTGPGYARLWGMLGLALAFVLVAVAWVISRDFRNVIGVPGLFLSWLVGILVLYPLFFTLLGCFKWEHQWWKIVR
jgi:hypothetical protein